MSRAKKLLSLLEFLMLPPSSVSKKVLTANPQTWVGHTFSFAPQVKFQLGPHGPTVKGPKKAVQVFRVVGIDMSSKSVEVEDSIGKRSTLPYGYVAAGLDQGTLKVEEALSEGYEQEQFSVSDFLLEIGEAKAVSNEVYKGYQIQVFKSTDDKFYASVTKGGKSCEEPEPMSSAKDVVQAAKQKVDGLSQTEGKEEE